MLTRRFGLLVTLLVATPLAAQDPPVDPVLFQGMEWRNIGPFRGGRSVAVAGVASDPYTYYFGGVGSGVWKTEDAGDTWRNISSKVFGTSSVGAIAVAPSDPNVVYVGMGEHAVRGVMTSHGDGVYRSTDAGRTWKHLGLAGTRQIAAIQIHPDDPDRVYAAAQGAPYGATEERGVYRSTDGGENWEKVLYVNETSGASSLSLDRNNPRILYAGLWDHLRQPWKVRSGGPGSGVYKSVDGGTTWDKIHEGLPDEMGKVSVSVSANSDRIYALVEADPKGGMYRSDNGGKNWNRVNESWGIRARAWYYIHAHADPQNPDVVWIMNARAYKSIDGGKTFSRVRTPHGDNHGIWINPTNSAYVINANDGGANVSLNGGTTWSTQRNQPTAQFYRVNTDNRFPYWVYGGQQDNSSVAIASRGIGSGVSWQDWHPMGGCESAYVAFDPDDPTLSYAGCYMGQISEFDTRTRRQRNIMAYPLLPAALASRDMTYRFNWNAPILVSQHNPQVIYHAGNVLLRSDDRGNSWTEASPDLTRDTDSTQGPGGGPITNEGAGGEIYNTLMYVAESPHDANTIWTGSDDGLIHVTQDGGQNWSNVTPSDLAEGMVNAIDVSPHDPAAAYVAFTRYKFNDFTPHIFKTTDYGQTWARVVTGIADEAHVRVVREDPVRRGLLYAGTEVGLYVSWDDGDNWQTLGLNMPVTPITDLKVQTTHNDLVAATQGRGFWILDDLTPLQRMQTTVADASLHVFELRDAYRAGGGGGFGGGGNPTVGKNPPAGAIINYYVAEVSDSNPVTIEILNDAGGVVRTYSSEEQDTTTSTVTRLKAKPGMNRFAWDLRHTQVPPVPGLYVWGTLRGRQVVPGSYGVRVTQGEESVASSVSVHMDPRVQTTHEELVAQDQVLTAIDGELAAIHEGVIQIRDVRAQVESLLERLDVLDDGAEVRDAGKKLIGDLTALEDSLVQKRTVDGQTVINFPSRLNFHYIYLRRAVDGSDVGVTQGARTTLSDLSAKWSVHRAELERLMGTELTAYNQLIAGKGIPAVMISPSGAVSPATGGARGSVEDRR